MLPSRRTAQSIAQTVNRRLIAETGCIPAGMQLIQDTVPFQVKDMQSFLAEGKDGKEQACMRVTGLFQLGDSENANGRLYETNSILQPAVRAIQEDVHGRAVIGEFDHPIDAKLHLDRASHLITKVWMDGRKVFGEAEILHKVPCGASLRGLFEHKVRVGISSRGMGDMEMIEHKGRQLYRVCEGYAFVTWDVVAEPSVGGAILNIQEGLNKRLRPIRQQQNLFSPEVYEARLVEEIEKYFETGSKRTSVSMSSSRLSTRR